MHNQTDEILNNVKSFPSIPGVTAKLLSLLNNPGTTAGQIEENLRYDPGLTANILKIANSPYFGFASKIGSIKQAVVLLGTNRLVQIIMASCMNVVLDKPIPGYDLSSGDLWRHSISVSVTSEGLMKMLNLPDTDEVFTAALLHDIGKLVLGEYVEAAIDQIEEKASDKVDFETAVRDVIGTDHSEIGARILNDWSFPSGLVSVTRWHHDPDAAEDTNILLDVVHIANVICMMMGMSSGREELRLEPSPMAIKRLGLKARHIEKLASQALQWTGELNNIFT